MYLSCSRPIVLRRCQPIWSCLKVHVRFNSSARNRWIDRQKNDFYTKEAKVRDLRSRAAFKLMEIDDKYHLFSKNSSQRVLDLGFAPGAWSQVAFDRTRPNGMVLGVDILPCAPPRGVSSIQANILSKRTHELVRLFFSKHFQLYKHDDLHQDHGYFRSVLEDKLQTLKQTDEYREIFSDDFNVKTNMLEEHPIDVVISDMYECWPQTSGFWNNLTNFAYDRMANTTGIADKDHFMSIDLCDAALVIAIDLLKVGGCFTCKLYTGKEDRLLESRLGKVFNKVHRFKPSASRNESRELYFVALGKKKNIDKLQVFS